MSVLTRNISYNYGEQGLNSLQSSEWLAIIDTLNPPYKVCSVIILIL